MTGEGGKGIAVETHSRSSFPLINLSAMNAMRGNYSSDEDPTKPFCWTDGCCNVSNATEADLRILVFLPQHEIFIWMQWAGSNKLMQRIPRLAMHQNQQLQVAAASWNHPLHPSCHQSSPASPDPPSRSSPSWSLKSSPLQWDWINHTMIIVSLLWSCFVHLEFLSSSGRLINLALSSKSFDHRRMFHLAQRILKAWSEFIFHHNQREISIISPQPSLLISFKLQTS